MHFTVAMISRDLSEVPERIQKELIKKNVDFIAKRCDTVAQFLAIAKNADVIWTSGANLVILPEILPQLKQCKAILRTGSGVDDLPVKEATRLGIWVANTPEAIAETVAEHTIALLFVLARQILFYDGQVRKGIWQLDPASSQWHISQQTLGLVGFGLIGRHVAAKLQGFSMNILAYDPFLSPEQIESYGAKPASFEEILQKSDFLSLHCPLTPKTFHLIGEKEFHRMKRTAFLINTSRGSVIDEDALIHALNKGEIAGAGLDVLEQEPPLPTSPLLHHSKVVLTPHIAAFSDLFEERFWDASLTVLFDCMEGNWQSHSVNRIHQDSE